MHVFSITRTDRYEKDLKLYWVDDITITGEFEKCEEEALQEECEMGEGTVDRLQCGLRSWRGESSALRDGDAASDASDDEDDKSGKKTARKSKRKADADDILVEEACKPQLQSILLTFLWAPQTHILACTLLRGRGMVKWTLS